MYEEGIHYFDDTRKWRERYVVVRANYCLECHESLESFVKGVPPRHKLLPTGGTVLTAEDSYMAMVDKCFPGDNNVKEDFAPPVSGMPGPFPVYLRLPYRMDWYFCFRQEERRAAFISILSDCIRHQNQDFLKKRTCEVQAFLKAIQLYRQDKGRYESWDMLIGSDVRVMSNLVMEKLLPALQRDLLPRLRARRTEKKRVWFATMEAAYILVQEHLLHGLSVLKVSCRTSARQQEVLMHSDMDQIINTRRQLEEKIRAKVSKPAERLCSESVQPYLGSVLEEMMEPISSGFLEGRQLSETMMDRASQDVLQGAEYEDLKKVLVDMARAGLLSCYQNMGSLQDKLQHLQGRFGFFNITRVVHSAQVDLQQLMKNAAYTFQLLLCRIIEDEPENAASVIEKAKHRVLKQYDYDSSTVRKRIFQDALVSVTLPFIKDNLSPICKTELQTLEQNIFADYSNFIHVENVYESILLEILDKEVSKVVKEAASLHKHNLFTDSSRSSLSSPPVSTPNSPALPLASPVSPKPEVLPLSPLVVKGLPPGLQRDVSPDATEIITPLGRVEPKGEETSGASQWAELPATREHEIQTMKEPEYEPNLSENQDSSAPQTLVQTETAAQLDVQDTKEPPGGQTSPSPVGRLKSEAGQTEDLDQTGEPFQPSAEGSRSEETLQSRSSKDKLEAPSGGEEAEDLTSQQEETGSVTASDPNSLDVSVGSDSPPSEPGSTGDASSISEGSEVAGKDPELSPETPTEAGANVHTDVHIPASSPSPEPPPSPETPPPDCITEIRDLVTEVIEVEELVQHYPGEE
nr:protein Niban 1 [Nothobranchius furzeri]